MLFEFLMQMDPKAIWVRAPSKFILLCGGRMSDRHEDDPLSLRDVFYKIIDGAIPPNASLVRAEDVNAFYIKGALLRKCPRDSVCKSSWLRGGDEQTAPRPLPHDKLEVL